MIAKLLLALTATGAGLAWYSNRLARQAEARVPADGRFVEIDGTRLHVVDLRPTVPDPASPPIVLVHGLCGQVRNFTYALATRLAERHRVVVLDRPGSGYSTPAPGPFPGLAAQARLVGRLIEALELEEPPLLVGHSLGGAISLALALEQPACVRGLALIAPLTQPVVEAPRALAGLRVPASLRWLIARTLAVPLTRWSGDKGLTLAFSPEPVPADFPVRGGADLALRPGSAFAASSDVCSVNAEMPALAARYGELRLPVAVLYGRDDPMLDHRLHGVRFATQAPGVELELIDGGHMLPVTRAAEVANWIERTLARPGA